MDNVIKTINLSKDYLTEKGQKIEVLKDINLTIEKQEFVCILGPSGSGKSTLLRLICGLEKATKGDILVLDKPINKPIKETGMVFQEYSLMPWRNLIDNVAFGLEIKKIKKKERYKIASKILEGFGLGAFKESFPHELSGGMQQRAAIARSIATSPQILYMDEPFGALDAYTRYNMQEELVDFWLGEKRTVLFVTHSVEEAILLGTRIIVIGDKPGRIVEDFKIDLDYPRNRWGEDFGSYFSRLMKLMRT